MATLAITNSFSNTTTAVASQVNTNFQDVASFANSSVVHKDGTVAMTGALTLPGAPVSPLQAATKGYVDGLVPAATSTWSPTITQGVGVGFTVAYAHYVRQGPLVTFAAGGTITGTGSTGQLIFFTLPVNHIFGSRDQIIGGGDLFVDSTHFYSGSATAWGGGATKAYINFTSLLTSSLTLNPGQKVTFCGTYIVA